MNFGAPSKTLRQENCKCKSLHHLGAPLNKVLPPLSQNIFKKLPLLLIFTHAIITSHRTQKKMFIYKQSLVLSKVVIFLYVYSMMYSLMY